MDVTADFPKKSAHFFDGRDKRSLMRVAIVDENRKSLDLIPCGASEEPQESGRKPQKPGFNLMWSPRGTSRKWTKITKTQI
jgi:hypothetical protein